MIDLFEHNKTAYDSAVSLLSETGKAAVIHPTGTGKSFIGFKLSEDHPDKVICWLSPSEYIFRTQLENLAKVSDGWQPENIRFYTYARLMNLAEEELADIHPDYIVLDEFHRCGAQEWGKGVTALLDLYADIPILGLSATNIRYLDNQRDMADELFDGNIASEMTLGDAIVRGILAAPKYVISIYSYQKELEKYKERVRYAQNKAVRDEAERYLDALRRTLEKAEGLDTVFAKHMTERTGKYIVFCANFEHMREMMDKVPEWFSKVDANPKIYSVYAADPSSSQSFADFKADEDTTHLRLLFCIDALNEGIHVDDISGVVLFRPTVSPIIYKQQIGRALAANRKSAPVIFDVVNNFENLYSISAIEEEMKVAIQYYRFQGDEKDIVNETFRIIDEVRDCRRLFDELSDTLSAPWNVMYAVAKRYFDEHGDLVPVRNYKTEEGYSLGLWLHTQRMIRRGTGNGHLTEAQIAKLDAIGMRWENDADCRWNRNYAELLNYYRTYGNIDVPSDYRTENGVALGQWIIRLRTFYRSGIRQSALTQERMDSLNALGMIWDKVDYIWESNYQALLAYYKEHGNTVFPKSYKTPDGIALGAWIYNIRTKYRISDGKSLTQSQKERLEAVGVDLSYEFAFERKWNENYERAKSYYLEHGDLRVPYGYVTDDGFALGTWVSRLRMASRRKTHTVLTDERRRQLDEIGMVWDSVELSSWELYYSALKQYYEEHGNIAIATKTQYHNLFLAEWLVGKRAQFKRGTLPEAEKRALDALGMDWLPRRERLWEDTYRAAEAFYRENGHLSVPSSMKSLNGWVIRQRTNYRNHTMTDEQYQRLSAIGMVWTIDDIWDGNYEKAKKFYEEHGNLDIPALYVTEDGVGLGSWYRRIRKEYLNGAMPEERMRQLDAIGMQRESVIRRNWMQNYEAAKRFYEENGHLMVRAGYITEDGVKLGTWITGQRENYKAGRLTDEQIALLEKIQMHWNRFEVSWDSYYSLAKDYFNEHGDLNIVADYNTEDGVHLGAWLANQKGKYKKFKLSELQISLLEKIGIVWNCSDDSWDEGYRHAEEYFRANGNLDVKTGYTCEDGFKLAAWLGNKRTSYRNSKLPTERVKALEKIGMEWTRMDKKWEQAYQEAEAYYRMNHHLNVPQKYQTESGFYLGSWVVSQRKNYKSGKLEAEKVRRLGQIGMRFETSKSQLPASADTLKNERRSTV